jgi:carbon-monoxide dehydrogenase medium subunit
VAGVAVGGEIGVLVGVAGAKASAVSAGAALIGQAPTEETFAAAAKLAQAAANPITDVRGTAAQRRHLIGVLVKRALREAVNRAKGESIHE